MDALRPSESTQKLPRTIVVLIAVWSLVYLYTFIVSRGPAPIWPEGPEPIEIKISDLLFFIKAGLMIALIGYGLIRKLRFAWIIAFVWQAIQAGLALLTLSLNEYEAVAYTHFAGIGFYGITLPIAVAVISFVLLLLPATRHWVGSR